MKQSETSGERDDGISQMQVVAGVAVLFLIGVTVVALLIGLPLSGEAGTKNLQTGVRITVAGSTTIQPVSEILSTVYTMNHPDVQILVEGGGSGTGIRRAAAGEIDIGAASRALEADERTLYPDLQVHQIGGSGVVLVVNREYPAEEITFAEVAALYNDVPDDLTWMPHVAGIRTVVQRSDSSGTEETFAQWLFGDGAKNVNAALNVTDTGSAGSVRSFAAIGNVGVLKAVRDDVAAIGFVDFGYAEGDTGVKILRIFDAGAGDALPSGNTTIRDAIRQELSLLNGRNDHYIEKLTRPLNYLTNGTPSPVEQDFIAFARSAEARKYFDEVGYFSMSEIAGSDSSARMP